jgi:predicted negative regulator of RcsB-dependent stress response
MAALIAAKSAYDSGDIKHTKELLTSVVTASKNEEYRALAKIRLSGILLDEKLIDEASKLIDSEFPEEFLADQADRKGDILIAQGKIDEARKAYQTALEKMKDKAAGKPLVQIKLDAIGGSADKS